MKKIINVKRQVFEYTDQIEIELPEQTTYWFETGIRRSICMRPIWTTWKYTKGELEEIWKYEFVCVYGSQGDNRIEKVVIPINTLQDVYESDRFFSPMHSFLKGWLDERDEESFNSDFEAVFDEIVKNG